MKNISITMIIALLFSFCPAADVLAEYVQLSWWQSRSDTDLRGWIIYYTVYDQTIQPDLWDLDNPGYTVNTINLVAMNGDEPLPLTEMPIGMKVVPYPDYEEWYWEPSYIFYLPPIPPDKKYYLSVTAYDLAGLESEMCEPIGFHMDFPGQPGQPVIDGMP